MKGASRELRHLAEKYRVENGRGFRLKRIDPDDGSKAKITRHAPELLAESLRIMNGLQEKLYAQGEFALLLVFQAMDAAGKDGTIKHVMSGINPQGCRVTSFKAPSSLEMKHDYLWRTTLALPQRGEIGIFNRSYYEEVLVVRVHPQALAQESIAKKIHGEKLWAQRFEDINAHERYLANNGTVIRKFFLHLSAAEQRRRFLSRLDNPAKNWKFSSADLKERGFWDDYQNAYEKMIRATSSKQAPWYVVPADHKEYAHLVVAGAVIDALKSLKLAMPEMSEEQRKALALAREQLGD